MNSRDSVWPLPLAARFFGICTFAILHLGCDFREAVNQKSTVTWPTTFELVDSTFPSVSQMPTEQLAELLSSSEKTESPLLIDVRSQEEFAVSHLPGAIRAETVSAVKAAVAEHGKNAPVVLYCSVGYRSSRLADACMKAGIHGVHNLDGSIFKWANEERTLDGQYGKLGKVHPYDEEWQVLLKPEHRYDASAE